MKPEVPLSRCLYYSSWFLHGKGGANCLQHLLGLLIKHELVVMKTTAMLEMVGIYPCNIKIQETEKILNTLEGKNTHEYIFLQFS